MPYRKNKADYIVKPDKYKHKKPKSNNPWSRNYDDSPEDNGGSFSPPQDYSQGYQNPYVHTPDAPVFDRPSVQDNEANLRSFMADSNKPPHLQNRWKKQPSKPDFSQLSDREKCCCEPKGEDNSDLENMGKVEYRYGKAYHEEKPIWNKAKQPWEKSAWEARKDGDRMMGKGKKTFIANTIETNVYVSVNENFNIEGGTKTIEGRWTVFHVNSLSDKMFIEHLKTHRWDNLVINTHGNSVNSEFGADRIGGYVKFAVNEDGKPAIAFSADFATYYKGKYGTNEPGGVRPIDETLYYGKTDVNSVMNTFVQIFQTGNNNANLAFVACCLASANQTLPNILDKLSAATTNRIYNYVFLFSSAQSLRGTDKGNSVEMNYDYDVPFDTDIYNFSKSCIGYKQGGLKIVQSKYGSYNTTISSVIIRKEEGFIQIS